MGVVIIPTPSKSDECPTCFDENMTPQFIVCSVTGIQAGDDWTDELPAPPNRTLFMENTGNCVWQGGYEEKETTVVFRWFADDGDFLITLGVPITVFEDYADPCTDFFTNTIIDPAGIYYGGIAQLLAIGDPPTLQSAQAIAELLNIQQDEHTKFDFWPVDSDEFVIRFARYQKGMNILVRFKP